MVGPRGPAFLLLCLPLIWQVEAQPKVFLVKAEGYRDGLYAEEGEGANHRWKKLGEADKKGRYSYIYRGTERADTWVVGRGQTFEERVAVFKAPAGGGDRLPPEEGWQWVDDGSSRDGKESGKEQPDMRVTGFNLKETTVDEFYEKGGEKRDDGIVCKIREMNSEYKSEEWAHIRWTDEEFCDKTKNCENGLDEPEGVCQQQVVVTGSDGRDGVYNYRNGGYKQEDGHNIIFKKGSIWVIAEGTNRKEAVVLYKSKESIELPREGWQAVVKKLGSLADDSVQALHVIQMPRDFDGNQTETTPIHQKCEKNCRVCFFIEKFAD